MTSQLIHPSVRIHPTALIEESVSIGVGSSVWDSVHIRKNTTIGENCIIGEKTYIAYGVKIGNGVKINSFVYICTAVTVEDRVMISAGTVFTNDRFPRAFDPDGNSVKTSDPTEETLQTVVCRGVTIGAGCTIGPGIELGEYSMVGMGAVVTRNVPPHCLVYGNPARVQGIVCVCGEPMSRKEPAVAKMTKRLRCSKCDRRYILSKKNQVHIDE
jgi:acetyltransferase-like isoleucine patch superfamily enzyme